MAGGLTIQLTCLLSTQLSRVIASLKVPIAAMDSWIRTCTALLETLGTRGHLKSEGYLRIEIITSLSGHIDQCVGLDCPAQVQK